MSTDINNKLDTWPYLPKDIQGVNYEMINKVANIDEILSDILSHIKTSQNFIKKYNEINSTVKQKNTTSQTLTSQTNENFISDNDFENNFDRLDPPFNFPCVFSEKDGCVKRAAFVHKNDGAYCCWFHKSMYRPK